MQIRWLAVSGLVFAMACGTNGSKGNSAAGDGDGDAMRDGSVPSGPGDGDGDHGDGGSDEDVSLDGGPDQPTYTLEILAKFGDVVVGGKTPMRALVRSADKILGGQALSWSSDTPAVATVEADTGIVTGVAEGSATISVTSNGASTSVNVRVDAAVAEPTMALGANSPPFYCVLSRAGQIHCIDLYGDHITDTPHIGIGDSTWIAMPSTVRFKKLVAASDVMLALGVDGQLYSFGAGGALLGQDFMDGRRVITPTAVATDTHFKEIAAAQNFAAALSEDGTLYEWGSFQAYTLAVPTATAVDAKFDSISVSGTHLLAHGTDGETYSWSRFDSLGQLYLGVPKAGGQHPGTLPTAIETGVPFATVAAALYTSFGITADGVVYSWGNRWPDDVADNPLQMIVHGRGESATPTDQPAPLATTEHFVRIISGAKRIMAQRADGVVFTWGPDAIVKLNPNDTVSYTTCYVPTEYVDFPLKTIIAAPFRAQHSRIPDYDVWLGFDDEGRAFEWVVRGAAPQLFEQPPFAGQSPSELTLARGSSEEVVLQPYTEAQSITANGIAWPSAELSPKLNTNEVGQESTTGKLDVDGMTYELKPATIDRGQAATLLTITPGAAATLGSHTVFAGGKTFKTTVVLPKPPPGTPVSLSCLGRDTPLPWGFWCLTNSGGATAPHRWDNLSLTGEYPDEPEYPNAILVGRTWQYVNVCILYGPGGYGMARFKNPDASISEIQIRYGVLARSNGYPETTDSKDWLLYHEGIGDPQVEQLTFNPATGQVGAAWPFTEGPCTF